MAPLTERLMAPNRVVSIEPLRRRLTLELAGHTIAVTGGAVRLLESGHEPMIYVPLEDVRDGVLRPSQRTSRCPWKGRAAYFDVVAGEEIVEDGAWSYPDPFPGALDLSAYVAFYPNTSVRTIG